MEIKEIQKDKKEKKSVAISIRTYPRFCEWMKKNNISPSALFNRAIEELMEEN